MNEQGLKERLKYIAKQQSRTFQDVWKTLVLERFLVRISRSAFASDFVFKGGLLLSHYINIGRETKDVDFLVRMLQAERSKFQSAFETICNVDVQDGFEFSFAEIVDLEQPHMNYPGYRVTLDVRFSRMKDRIHVDIGVGDAVEPNTESLELYQYKNKPIFEGTVTLQVYPIETIFAEKLETCVSKGAANSRMKDFHDLFLLCSEQGLLSVSKLRQDIERTFQTRGTAVELPINFLPDELPSMQRLWSGHFRGLGPVAKALDIPERFDDVLNKVNDWLDQNKVI